MTRRISYVLAVAVCLVMWGLVAGSAEAVGNDVASNADTVRPCPDEWLTDARFFYDNGMIPGAFVIVNGPEWGLRAGYVGYADIAVSRPFDAGMRFRAGELSRLMMTVLVLQLEHEKKLALDDTIDDILGGGFVPNGDAISLRDCLMMRTGLFDYKGDEAIKSAGKSGGDMYLPEEILFKIRSQLHHQSASPGAGFDESDTGFLLVALVVEKIEGKSVGESMEERIFRPLGMNDSFFAYESHIPEPLVHGYTHLDSLISDCSFYNPTALGPARSVVSTPFDTLRFLRELFEGRTLLTKRSYTLMMSFANARNGEDAFGLGLLERVSRRGTWRGFESNVSGYTAMAGYYMQGETYVMVITNSDENKFVCREIFRNVLRRVSGCPADYSPPKNVGADISGGGVQLSWQAGFIYGDNYRVFVGRDWEKVNSATAENHTDVTLIETGAKGFRAIVRGLTARKRYFWRVEAVRKRPETEMENARKWRDSLLEQHPDVPWFPVMENETVSGPISTFFIR